MTFTSGKAIVFRVIALAEGVVNIMYLSKLAVVLVVVLPVLGAEPAKKEQPTVVAVRGGQRLKLTAEAEGKVMSLSLALMRSNGSYIGGVKTDAWDHTLLKSHVHIVFPEIQTVAFRLHQIGRPEQEEMKYKELLFGSGFGYIRNGDDVRAWTKYDPDPAIKLENLLKEAVRAGDPATVTGKREGQAVKVNADIAREAATLAVDLLTRTESEADFGVAKKRWKEVEQQSHLRIVLSKPRSVTLRFSRDGKMKEEKVEISELVFTLPKDEEPDTIVLLRSGATIRGFGRKHPESWFSDASIWIELQKILKEAPRTR